MYCFNLIYMLSLCFLKKIGDFVEDTYTSNFGTPDKVKDGAGGGFHLSLQGSLVSPVRISNPGQLVLSNSGYK